jgi:hypothetical protein
VYADEAIKRNRSPKSIVAELLQLALEKLLCTDSTSIPATTLTQSQAIALLGSTIQPKLYGAAKINVELVASHAAVELIVRGFILTPMRRSQARGGVRWTRFET